MLGFLFWIFMSSILHGNLGMQSRTVGAANIFDHASAAAVPSPRAAHVRPNTGVSAGSRDEGLESEHGAPGNDRTAMVRVDSTVAKHCASGLTSFTLSFARKRSYKRALKRAEANGSAWYRGQWLSLATLRKSYVSNAATKTEAQHIPAASRSQCKRGSRFSLRVFSWNCGGLSNLKDELHTWLQEHGSDYSVVLLQETWYKTDMDFIDRGWICINSGIGEGAARAHAGVMVLLRKDVFDQSHVRFHSVVPGRVLHVQALCRGGWLNVVNVYQYSWGLAADEAQLLTKRATIWDKVRDTLGQIPKGNFLIAGGDLNTATGALLPWLGRGMLQKDKASTDSDCLEQLVQDYNLCAVNSFGRPTTFTYVHEGYKVPRKSFVDYVLLRKFQSGTSSAQMLSNFEVGRWRAGGRHLPVIVSATLKPYLHQVHKAPREWPVWKCKLLQQAVKEMPELATQFQARVQEQLEAEIEYKPQQFNQLLLQVGRQVFDVQRPRAGSPAWAAEEHTSLIKRMWSHYRVMKRRRCLPGTRAILLAWRHQVAFLRLHRAVQKHSRQLRRQHFDQLLAAAEQCDKADGASATFTLIKKWAPKQAKKRTQLRAPTGRLLCPAEEVKELATFWKDICAGEDVTPPVDPSVGENTFSYKVGSTVSPGISTAPNDGKFSGLTEAPRPSQQPRYAYHVTREELERALGSLKGNKAAPAHCAPHIMWKLAAGPIAEFMDMQVLAPWRQDAAEVYEDWSASWLTFLNKPNRPGNKPGDLRPISLLEPAGKAMSGVIKQHLMPYLQPWVEARHLYGYLPNRSPQQALSIVFQHCAAVRDRATAQGRNLYAIRQGHQRGGCAGGLQVSIDFTQAFDRVDRSLLNSALLLMKVPDTLRCLIMQWVETTTFHVVQDDAEAVFTSSRGIRQGCKLSPSLWICISMYLLHLIEQEMGADWCNKHLVGFADDTHLRWDVLEAAHVHQALAQAHCVLHLLEKAGLKLSRDKTVCLLRLEGAQAPHIKRKITEMTKDGRVLKLGPEYILPLKQDHVYLGACITYGNFEHKNMKHRVHAGRVAFQRVRKFLMAEKAATLQKRLRLWKAIVIPTVMYSLTASGVLPKGFELLRIMLTKQARAIARSPRHRLGGENGDEVIAETDAAFWHKVGIDTPEKQVKQRLEAMVNRTAELGKLLSSEDVRVCAVVRGREQAMLSQFQDRCIQTASATALHVCDVCHAEFGDYSSLRAHKAKLHSSERRQMPAPVFDRQRHGVDGMPKCSMCGHQFLRWADLQKHVTGNFCQQSQSNTQVAEAENKPSVLQRAREGELQVATLDISNHTAELKQELLQHCAICRQWQPDSKYIKIHWGRVHKAEWKKHEASTFQWRRAQFARIKGTCDWCDKQVTKGSVHTDSCPVLFQLSMIRAMVTPSAGQDTDAVSGEPDPIAVPLPVVAENKHWTKQCQLCQEHFTARGMSKHMEQAHANQWLTSKPVVNALCAQWAASLKSPCQFCGGAFQRATQHVHVCHVLFQAAFKHSLQLAPVSTDHGGSSERGGDSVHGDLRSDHAGTQGHGDETGCRARGPEWPQQAATSGDTDQLQGQGVGQEQPGRSKMGSSVPKSGTVAGSLHSFFRRPSAHAAHHSALASAARHRDADDQDGQAVSSPLRDGAPGNGSLVLGCGAGVEKGQSGATAEGGQVSSSHFVDMHDDGTGGPLGQDVGSRSNKGQPDQARVASDSAGAASLAVHAVDGDEVRAGRRQSGDSPQRHDGNHPRDQEVPAGQVRGADTQVPLRTPPGGADGGGNATVFAINQHARGASGSDLPALQKVGGQHGAQDRGGSTSWRAPQAPATGATTGGGHGAAADEQVRKTQRQVLGIRLRNPHNICYINAFALLWAWAYASTDTSRLEQLTGRAKPALRAMLQSTGVVNILDSFAWRFLLTGWTRVAEQHDVSEWIQHVMFQVDPLSFAGTWQARLNLDGSLHVRDAAEAKIPVILKLTTGAAEYTLQDLFDGWSSTEEAVRGFSYFPQDFCCCVARFDFSSDAQKLRNPVSLIEPEVRVPCFIDNDTVELQYASFQVLGAIAHYGDSIRNGHYRAFLRQKECWYVTDDNTKARKAKAADMLDLWSNCYVIWLRSLRR